MKYQKGIEIICIKDKPNFIKGKAYKIEEVYVEELTNDKLLSIEVKDEKGEINIIFTAFKFLQLYWKCSLI